MTGWLHPDLGDPRACFLVIARGYHCHVCFCSSCWSAFQGQYSDVSPLSWWPLLTLFNVPALPLFIDLSVIFHSIIILGLLCLIFIIHLLIAVYKTSLWSHQEGIVDPQCRLIDPVRIRSERSHVRKFSGKLHMAPVVQHHLYHLNRDESQSSWNAFYTYLPF